MMSNIAVRGRVYLAIGICHHVHKGIVSDSLLVVKAMKLVRSVLLPVYLKSCRASDSRGCVCEMAPTSVWPALHLLWLTFDGRVGKSGDAFREGRRQEVLAGRALAQTDAHS